MRIIRKGVALLKRLLNFIPASWKIRQEVKATGVGLFFMSLAVLFSLACGNSADHGEGTSILSPTKRQPAPQVESVCSGYAGVLEEAQAVATGNRSLQEPGIAAQLQTLASTAKQAGQPLMERALTDLRLPFWLPGVAMSQEGTRRANWRARVVRWSASASRKDTGAIGTTTPK